VAYATVDELAAALRVTLTPANTPGLQACLDAAAIEIDDAIDRAEDSPVDTSSALLNRVNLLRGVEWAKSNDAAFGIVGMADTGALQTPRDGFYRHRLALLPHKQRFGVA